MVFGHAGPPRTTLSSSSASAGRWWTWCAATTPRVRSLVCCCPRLACWLVYGNALASGGCGAPQQRRGCARLCPQQCCLLVSSARLLACKAGLQRRGVHQQVVDVVRPTNASRRVRSGAVFTACHQLFAVKARQFCPRTSDPPPRPVCRRLLALQASSTASATCSLTAWRPWSAPASSPAHVSLSVLHSLLLEKQVLGERQQLTGSSKPAAVHAVCWGAACRLPLPS